MNRRPLSAMRREKLSDRIEGDLRQEATNSRRPDLPAGTTVYIETGQFTAMCTLRN